jgi:dUTP pyrophosphatase
MQDDEVLSLYPRSSTGIVKGLMLSNTVGKIDSSYYENETNDGNIGLPLLNTSGKGLQIKRGDRIVQGIFTKYLTTDDDAPTSNARVGGMGSSGE